MCVGIWVCVLDHESVSRYTPVYHSTHLHGLLCEIRHSLLMHQQHKAIDQLQTGTLDLMARLAWVLKKQWTVVIQLWTDTTKTLISPSGLLQPYVGVCETPCFRRHKSSVKLADVNMLQTVLSDHTHFGLSESFFE